MQRVRERQQGLALIFDDDDTRLVPDFPDRLSRVLDEAKRWPRPCILPLGAVVNFYTPAAQPWPGQFVYAGNRIGNMEVYVPGVVKAQARLDWIALYPMTEPIDIAFNTGDLAIGILYVWPEPSSAGQGSLNDVFNSSLNSKGQSRPQLSIQFAVHQMPGEHLALATKAPAVAAFDGLATRGT